ncbi:MULTISPECIES: hypothetical protein [Bizionia]|uniref:GIY-YIG domain-containing protein n=1 Tax=Bizionia algoritergicola TaxID=291187 RepID=A0A5D0R1E3_9FLAO|nr:MULTISPECIES: hypothetical protein [Bizionia]OBX24417.1 hypothetical protein BAA08_01080 [Bizionia sp. APA-3]TYB75340.1 hypothetical protein ES675_04225 [Bizionia algoritergicola]
MNINLPNILFETDNYLDSLKSALGEITISKKQTVEFNSSEFRNREILNSKIKKVDKSKLALIYTIELKQRKKLSELLRKFEDFCELNKLKVKNKDRVNVSRYNKTNSRFLYVGSSTTDFYSRLKNHFGTRGTRVYSMHLSKWDKNMNYDLIVNIYKVEHQSKIRIDQVLVELIEQQLWEKLKPNFGKKSGQ